MLFSAGLFLTILIMLIARVYDLDYHYCRNMTMARINALIIAIKKLVSPPVFPEDGEKTRIADLMNVFLWITLLIVLVIAATAPFVRDEPLPALIAGALFVALFIAGLVLIRRGHVHNTAAAITVILWGMFALFSIFSGGVGSPTLINLLAVILAAGLLLGGRASLIVAGLSCLLAAGIYLAEKNQALPSPFYLATPASTLEILAANYVTAGILLYLTIRSIQIAFRRARSDLAERKQAEQKTIQTASQLVMLNEIGRAVSEVTDLNAVLEIIRQQLEKVVEFDFYSVRVFNDKDWTVTYLAVYENGRYWNEPESALVPGTHGYQVFESGDSILHLMTQEEVEAYKRGAYPHVGDYSQTTTSLIFVPLKKQGKTIGALSVQRYQPNAYTLEHLQLVEAVAIQVSIAIENARLFTRLQQELEERTNAEAQIYQLNEELEQRVRERTGQLEAVNQELEAFSYSVSHDLRAPLRAINGYSLAVLEDYGDQLDETGREYLERVRTASQHMGQLIEDLLKLSRITRAEMAHRAVDLSHLFDIIMADLQVADPQRRVNVISRPGLVACGDERLLGIMLSNLCGNAWKFTSKKTLAEIEFGCLVDESEPVFFVRDNGAGFDMAYVDKLFGTFQRLHSPQDFDGTGIGLATVRRIVQRHGGQIWAQGVVDGGATFYFTVGEIPDN
jgi:signal transduction histidine kinase